jgi:hypothetical protein
MLCRRWYSLQGFPARGSQNGVLCGGARRDILRVVHRYWSPDGCPPRRVLEGVPCVWSLEGGSPRSPRVGPTSGSRVGVRDWCSLRVVHRRRPPMGVPRRRFPRGWSPKRDPRGLFLQNFSPKRGPPRWVPNWFPQGCSHMGFRQCVSYKGCPPKAFS